MNLPLYEIDNFEECLEQDNMYCVADLEMEPTSSVSSVWTNILEHDDFTLYDRRFTHRGICLPLSGNNSMKYDPKNYIEMMVNTNLSHYNLTSTIEYLSCRSPEVHMTRNDFVLLSFLICYLVVIFVVSILDKNGKKPKSNLGIVLEAFSVRKNWNKITASHRNEAMMKLASVQGIRSTLMAIVVILHTLIRISWTYYENVKDVEEFLNTPYMKIVEASGVVIVNSFLLISAFIYTIQVVNIHNNNNSLTVRNAFVLILHRYFRFFVPVIFVIGISQFTLIEKLLNPLTLRYWAMNHRACQKSWIFTLLLANNYQRLEEMCFAPTWYLSADFQGGIVITGILYFALKNKKSLNIIFFCLGLSILMHGAIIYIKDIEFAFIPQLRNCEPIHFMKSSLFVMWYSGLHSTISVSLLGMMFGMIYEKTKNYKLVTHNAVYQLLWVILALGCVFIATYLMLGRYNKIMRPFVGPIVKPLFTAGIGFIIIGMSFGFGGGLKRFFEKEQFHVLGKISFSVYICNLLVILRNRTCNEGLPKFSKQFLLPEIGMDLTLSLIYGTVFAILVEYPAITVKNMLLPHIKFLKKS